jgi:murein L,D-transpeptidase YcbB/YkuD
LGSDVDEDTIAKLRTYSLHVRQKAGDSNALGLVKFMFPNDNNVYLHSTPQRSHFSRTRRDLSHGCIRVEDPVALAEWALRNQPMWTKEKIRAAMAGQRDDLYISLGRSIPVMILYATAAASEDGQVRFFDDIYGHDAKLATALNARAPKVLLASL